MDLWTHQSEHLQHVESLDVTDSDVNKAHHHDDEVKHVPGTLEVLNAQSQQFEHTLHCEDASKYLQQVIRSVHLGLHIIAILSYLSSCLAFRAYQA